MLLLGHVLSLWAFHAFLSGVVVSAVRPEEFYEFGDDVDQRLPQGDDVFVNVTLETFVSMFGETYNTVFISTNGLVSFLTPLDKFVNVQFPLNIPVIAPLYANADTSRRGVVYWRESNRDADLVSSLNTLRRLFPNLSSEFQPLGVLIVTWEGIGMYGDETDEKSNTFQLAITTDGDESFVEFLYKDDGIQWVQSPNSNPEDSAPSVRAQAGIVSPSGKTFTLRGSSTDQVINLDKWTNGDKEGQYVFKIGNDDGGSGIVEQPHIPKAVDVNEQPKTCAEGYLGCHSDAQCVDSPSGVCCTCRSQYIGNGVSCLKQDMPLRVNGPITINLNDVRLEKLLFEGYVVVKDGRVYIAIDSLPASLGPAMQFLKPLESLPGWLFAIRTGDTDKNGFQLTGAVLNHTATLTFSPQHIVQIKQAYLGPDVFDKIKVNVEISGRIPEFSPDLRLKLPEFEEIYTKTSPGEYRSTSTQTYLIDGGETTEILVEQTIQFEENCHSEAELNPQRLILHRNYITFKDPILRMASFHKFGDGAIVEDPCIKGRAQCVANSSCLVQGDSYKCVCNSGFQTEHYSSSDTQLGCVDINECQDRIANCHENALCINEVGTYSCNCNIGFKGDGRHCEPNETTATEHVGLPGALPANMFCSDNSNVESCRCQRGFEIQFDDRSGVNCVDIDECTRMSVCSTYARCENFDGGFECRCNDGFHGDGRDCEPAGCATIECPAGSVCDDREGSPRCVCLPGFSGTPPSCFPRYRPSSSGSDDCETDSDCPQTATCSAVSSRRTCICPDGSAIDSSGVCSAEVPPVAENIQRLFKTCYEGSCWCPPDYRDDGSYCVKGRAGPQPRPVPVEPTYITEDNPESCTVLNNCHPYASCLPAMSVDDGYRCMCNPGYEGDGYNCSETELSCKEADICHKNAHCVLDEVQQAKHVCICIQGYVGDGYYCYPAGQCTEDSNCGAYGVCEYNEDREAHECGCRQGYVYSSGDCVPDEPAEPVACSTCDPNAACVLKGTINECQCNDGYRGDGLSCTEIVRGCDTLRNCDPNAQCLYSPEEEGYRCQCQKGFEGDGVLCNEIITCYHDPALCHREARCLFLDTKYMCKCNDGYFGNGTICKEAADQKENFLLLTKGSSILKVPFSPTKDDPGIPINIHGSQIAVGITTDCVEGKVYWSDITTNTIKRAKYDGSEFEEFVETKGESPEGLALDWINRQIYWTDATTDKISTANLDTKEVKVVIDTNLKNPRGIAVHPFRRKLYWSDWNRMNPKIEESDLDGTRRRILISGNNVKLPNALTIDWESDELCWSDAGTKTIDCMYLNQRLPNTVVKNCTFPFGLAMSSDKYYWTDWNTYKIMLAPKAGGTPISSIDVTLGGTDRLYGLATVLRCPR